MATSNHLALLEHAGVPSVRAEGCGDGEPVLLAPVHLAPGEEPRFAERQ